MLALIKDLFRIDPAKGFVWKDIQRTLVMPAQFNQPIGGNQIPRFSGHATMMRLPTQENAEGLDVCFAGVPFDIGTSNRSGARFGPRQILAESCLLRDSNIRCFHVF